MKTLFIFVMVCMISLTAFAGVEKTSVERNVASQLLRVKALCNATAGQLINIRDSVAKNANKIDSGDLTKLNEVKTDMNSAISALNAVIAEVDTQFPEIE